MFANKMFMKIMAAVATISAFSVANATDVLIPVVSKGAQHQFWQAVHAGAEEAAEELGITVTFEGPDDETQVDNQMKMLTAALANNPAAIGFAALDSQVAIPLLRQASEAGIPIVAFDSGVESDIPVATAATDNLAASSLAADKMAEWLDGSGKVAVVAHDQNSKTGVDRRDGFINNIKSNYPGIEVVAIEYAGDLSTATEATRALLAAHPDLKGIFGTNEGTANGIVKGVQETGANGITIIGFDSGRVQKDAIRNGLMAGAITQNPVGIGYETVKAAYAASKGESVPKDIDTGFYWYDKANIDNPEIAAVLYD